MTLVAGVAPDGGARAVLHLAGLLARFAGERVVLCAVVPLPWPPGPARVDAEYREELEATAQSAVEDARARLPEDLPASTLVHHARSAPAGLLEVAARHEASLVVVGSSSAGALGQVSLGSVSGRLLHSAPLPVALAPPGFRCAPEARVRRVTVAFGGAEGAAQLVVAGAAAAARLGAGLRVASFAVRSRPPYTSGVGREGDEDVLRAWLGEVGAAARASLERVRALPVAPPALETVVGRGESWAEALEDVEWEEGEILVVGSSSVGPVARVFLGSRATKIVRHSPVPVVVVPRGASAFGAARRG
jgi:nucleotide-binding universal stress UspA family protein